MLNPYALLSGLPDFAPLVAHRIYPVNFPTNSVMPCATYKWISGDTYPTMLAPGTARNRLQVECFAPDYLGATTTRDVLIADLNGFSGFVAGVNVMSARMIGPMDGYDEELEMHVAMAEFYLLTNT